MGAMFCFFPAILTSSTYTDKNKPCFLWTSTHSQFGTFLIKDPIKFFRTFLSHNGPASGYPYRFRSRGSAGSSRIDHDLGHLFRGIRIHKTGHSDFGMLSSLGTPSDFTWVYTQVLRRLLVHHCLVVSPWHPWLSLQSFVKQTSLV